MSLSQTIDRSYVNKCRKPFEEIKIDIQNNLFENCNFSSSGSLDDILYNHRVIRDTIKDIYNTTFMPDVYAITMALLLNTLNKEAFNNSVFKWEDILIYLDNERYKDGQLTVETEADINNIDQMATHQCLCGKGITKLNVLKSSPSGSLRELQVDIYIIIGSDCIDKSTITEWKTIKKTREKQIKQVRERIIYDKLEEEQRQRAIQNAKQYNEKIRKEREASLKEKTLQKIKTPILPSAILSLITKPVVPSGGPHQISPIDWTDPYKKEVWNVIHHLIKNTLLLEK